ncbi:MAG TPA: hypothetical protein VE934_13510 [Polaromonas sp.]|uniref:hypothetical protein n=1 Tax=Polaromonas sp. TaxID=1869339 RepID=UPI002D67F660|nr:hypothetical protein [Polaromonas sp.]HYW57977.1 hypothetical protein [Polaromonas sp.]
MTLTFSRSTFEVSLSHLYARIGGREVFIKREAGQPLRFLSSRREGSAWEVWGLGLYAVVNPL